MADVDDAHTLTGGKEVHHQRPMPEQVPARHSMAELPPRCLLSVGAANALCPGGGKKSCIGREIPGDRCAERQALRDERWNGLGGHGAGGLDASVGDARLYLRPIGPAISGVQAAAEAMGVPMVVGSAVREMLAITRARFGADSDFTHIAKVLEE